MNYRLLISALLGGLVAVFIVQNVEVVEVRFLFWTFAMSRALLLFFFLAAGVIVGWLLCSRRSHRKAGPR